MMINRRLLSLVFLSVCLSSPAYAAADFGPRKQLATIILSGLGGAVLGLSTLSFYGRPQDHLSNINTGLALGVIIGAGYTFYKVAKNPAMIGEHRSQEFGRDATWAVARSQWQREEALRQGLVAPPHMLNYSFSW